MKYFKILILFSLLLPLTGCDPGSKQAFTNSIKAAKMAKR
jgi:hypothetical protein